MQFFFDFFSEAGVRGQSQSQSQRSESESEVRVRVRVRVGVSGMIGIFLGGHAISLSYRLIIPQISIRDFCTNVVHSLK